MHIINFNFLTFWRNLKLNWTNSSSDVNQRSLQKTLQFPFVEPSLPQICLDCEWAIKWGCAEARLSFNIVPRQFAKCQLSSNLTDEEVEQMLNSKRLRVVELWGRRNRRLLVMINVASWSLLSGQHRCLNQNWMDRDRWMWFLWRCSLFSRRQFHGRMITSKHWITLEIVHTRS